MPPQLDRDLHGLVPLQHYSSSHFHQLFRLHLLSVFNASSFASMAIIRFSSITLLPFSPLLRPEVSDGAL